MRNSVLGIIAISILMITGCAKNASSTMGGTWSFKAVNYSATSFATGYGLVTVNNQPTVYSTQFTTLTVYFYNGLPDLNSGFVSGTFKVVTQALDTSANTVSMALNIADANGNALYRSTGGGGNQTVNVSVSNGNLTISGSNIELSNVVTPSDSGALNLDIIQP